MQTFCQHFRHRQVPRLNRVNPALARNWTCTRSFLIVLNSLPKSKMKMKIKMKWYVSNYLIIFFNSLVIKLIELSVEWLIFKRWVYPDDIHTPVSPISGTYHFKITTKLKTACCVIESWCMPFVSYHSNPRFPKAWEQVVALYFRIFISVPDVIDGPA